MLVVAAAGSAFALWYRNTPRPAASGRAARPVPGAGQRVQVEVLNASGVTGLARIATQRLRDAGLDVVYFGSDTSAGALDSTLIVLRRGDEAATARVRAALGAGAVRTATDPTRLVDVTVRLGLDFSALVSQP